MVLDLPSTLKLSWKPEELGKLVGVPADRLAEVHFTADESYVDIFTSMDSLNSNQTRKMKSRIYLERDMS